MEDFRDSQDSLSRLMAASSLDNTGDHTVDSSDMDATDDGKPSKWWNRTR